MAYETQEMIDLSIKAIKENDLIFIDEIFAYVPFCEKTFTNHELRELPDIKRAIEDNRIKKKVALRKKWYESDNPTVQIALFKLLATPEERDILNIQKIDATEKVEVIKGFMLKKYDSRKDTPAESNKEATPGV